ncbi:MAG: ATP phosphoribosyltransferase regulatory subunit [Provencibacterium sp.]|nr:ATP phosphoribosyltransferase regulatory subunit [Provencibacterium sp.]
MDRMTPASTRDLLYEECEALRGVQNRLCALYAGRGFREVMTPAMEYSGVFAADAAVSQRMVRLMDTAGQLCCLRPDCTLPIARLCGTKLQHAPLPIRLFYSQQVYSAPREHSGKEAEVSQVGVELIGETGLAADIEILSLASESLQALGGGHRLEICHIGFFRSLIAGLTAAEAVKEQVRALIEQKSYAMLGDLLAPYREQPAARALCALPRLFGTRSVLEKARALQPGEEGMQALDYLEELLDRLEQAGLGENITIDLGLINHADYYTGVIFRGYGEGLGEAVLSGGRYDRLLGRFGRDLPATGFGVNATLASRGGAESGRPQEEGITLALTKGRLERKTAQMLAALGYDCSALEEKGRRLVLPLGDSGIRVILAKAADVITYVENGVADVGIVGKDTILESGGSFYEVLDLGFGKCRFALAAKSREAVFSGYSAKRIASKYPHVALSYFEGLGLDVNIVKIEGSVELAPLIGLCDAIVDIVETGSTLKENGLQVIEEIAPISARMIVNAASMKLRQQPVERLISQVEDYLRREG